MRRLIHTLSSAMILLGISLLVAVGALYAYGAYEKYRFEHTTAMQAVAEAALGVNILEDTSATSPSDQGVAVRELLDSVLDQDPSASDTVPIQATPTEKPKRMPPATRIRIPKIKVDSPVVEAPLESGEWQVPKFVAGHLEGTANPGEIGNVALSGHVESIASGNVFSRLKELSVGDNVTLFSSAGSTSYTVTETKVVKNDDLSVIAPTREPFLTLITCTGAWNPLTRDYAERLIVVAKPIIEGQSQ